MTPRRIFLLSTAILLSLLGVYTWNQRTAALDTLATHGGLESGSFVLKGLDAVRSRIEDSWGKYVDLVGIREENERLKAEIAELRSRLLATKESEAELQRLRRLLQIEPPEGWTPVGCRVLGRRIGPNSPLLSLTLGRGYLSGAIPQTPVMTPQGVAGVIFRSAPHSSTALLLTDPAVHIAVMTQRGRINGILRGTGAFKHMELNFIPHDVTIENGEPLITSGMDGIFPKGLPVATVASFGKSKISPFLTVTALPLADLTGIEEVTLLLRPDSAESDPSGKARP